MAEPAAEIAEGLKGRESRNAEEETLGSGTCRNSPALRPLQRGEKGPETTEDSHSYLPTLRRGARRQSEGELCPFKWRRRRSSCSRPAETPPTCGRACALRRGAFPASRQARASRLPPPLLLTEEPP